MTEELSNSVCPNQKPQAAVFKIHIGKKVLAAIAVGCGILGMSLMTIAVATPFWVKTAERVYIGNLREYDAFSRKVLTQATGMENPEVIVWWMSGLWYVCTMYENSNMTAGMRLQEWLKDHPKAWPTPDALKSNKPQTRSMAPTPAMPTFASVPGNMTVIGKIV